MSNKAILRKNYKPYPFKLNQVRLDFDLYDDHALVKSFLVFERLGDGDLLLYGDELELVSVSLNQQPVSESEYVIDNGHLSIKNCPESFSLEVETRIYPHKNTALSGLYKTETMFCTQCEAEGFRRMTFFPDRPDVLSVYTTKITADKAKYPNLLSNGNLIESGDVGDDRHFAVWQDPFKKPSYLFALVAGDLACVKDSFKTMSGRTVDLQIFVEHGNEDKCEHAMTSLKESMRWDEEQFGREYDLDIFMIVAVSDFNMGAMENKGLNIFNSKYILARPDTASDNDYLGIEGVVAHEYFHNWTGNRVTCRDWFQLSLKEGLTVFRDQEFSSDMNSREVCRIGDVKTLINAQFPEDSGAMAHPVRPESYEEINNFYTATIYNKGAEVIRMQHSLVGKNGFRQGMDLYFERHDGDAVTIDDFVAAMEDANSIDLTQFKHWYSQAGTPEVVVNTSFADGQLTISMSQTCRPTPECQHKKPFHIPVRVGLFDDSGNPIKLEQEVLELKEHTQSFVIKDLKAKPLVSLLRGFSAPVKLDFEQSEHELASLLQYETDGYAKWRAGQRLAMNYMKKAYQTNDIQLELPVYIKEAFLKMIQDESVDPALRAEVLMPPGFEEVASELHLVDVGRLEAIRNHYRQELGLYLYDALDGIYDHLWERENHEISHEAFHRRKLRNSSLWLMMKANHDQTLDVCQTQFAQSKTMTDQVSAFNLLVSSTNDSARTQSIDAFFEQWKQDELVMDKWFSAQALCELPGALERVKKLMTHAAFNMKNPNKVRALIGSFCFGNYQHFHAEDGSGYEFLTEILLKLDELNPQVSARMATPFTRWQRLDNHRQELMKNQLKRLKDHSLSKDLHELVTKSLQATD